ncbi:polysaccharide pyruvyl transferase family protein [Brevibacterium sp. BDJS002]|uniref:polysaccharide pyruvyl transferase family protein n=1 Tax=Brevibacterium sp. BDJS002 TaxID=3020906 RepID=UPI0023077D49|nr:polysaccharide pyruvyl transferase family protein [Brevibacterium sp. BDJS002]WCE39362.1 polysaccharide pyruvyl transferase family protein [Brevibacterium sp. BDJS002]
MTQNVLATNVGNLLFGQSMFRALSVEGTEVVANSFNSGRDGIDDEYIQRINDEFDCFVVPLANAFRPSFRRNLANLTRVIEGLDIPVTVVGVGSQHPLNGGDERNADLDEDVKRFMSAVLDRSASVGVRGIETSAYLKRIGFGEEHVDVIGCPSIFMYGPNPTVRALEDDFSQQKALAMSASPETGVMVPVIRDHAERFERFSYIPQNSWDLNTMVWAEPRGRQNAINGLVNPDSLLHVRDQVHFPLDPDTWVEFLKKFDFVLGTRIHGSVAGILSGTPTLLVAHDSRTRELADYHQIPYVPLDKISENTRAEDLYQYADYSKFHAGLAETFDRFTAFLGKNGLRNIYQSDSVPNDYDEKLSAAELPPMVHPILAEGEAGRREMASRLWWLRQGKKTDNSRMRYAFKSDLPHTKKPTVTVKSVDKRLSDEMKKLRSELAETQKLVKAQAKVIDRLDVPISKRAKRYVKRLVDKPKGK